MPRLLNLDLTQDDARTLNYVEESLRVHDPVLHARFMRIIYKINKHLEVLKPAPTGRRIKV